MCNKTWVREFGYTYTGVKKEDIWKIWSDIDNWHEWNPGVEYCRLKGAFAIGNSFVLKPKAGPEAEIELVEVEENKKFTDCSKFPGARMYGMHEIEDTEDGVRLTTTLRLEGFLKYLWILLVARKIVAKIPEQTDNLIALAKKRS